MSGVISDNTVTSSGVVAPLSSATLDANNPAIDTNPTDGLGTKWINTTSGEIFICTDATTDSNTWIGQTGSFLSGGRGLFGGGTNTATNDVIDIQYVEISTLSGGADFGDLSTVNSQLTGTSNSINERGLFAGGGVGGAGQSNKIEYVTISSLGNYTDFGDLTVARTSPGGLSNGTNERGVFPGGADSSQGGSGSSNVIDYVTISTTGNAIDFGNLTEGARYMAGAGTSNNTNERGIIAGGKNGSNWLNVIQYITINSTGNGTDFGDMSQTSGYVVANSNGTNDRAVLGVVYNGSFTNIIEYITISTTGNAADFGDLTLARSGPFGSSNGPSERAIFGGGYATSAPTNTIDYITINSTGNAADFGDLQTARYNHAALSNVQG
jgi:hypothetical protein